MKLIVGLGNPGNEYAQTRHNVGFFVLDALCKKLDASDWREKFNALVAEARTNGEKILLAKPLTYMNNSGLAVGQIRDFYKLDCADIAVAHDDMDLSVGKVRIRAKGSSGGHNGIKSIIAALGSEEFARFRIGIGHPAKNHVTNAHVLTPFNDEEREAILPAVEHIASAVECFIEHDINTAMNRFNKRDKRPRVEQEVERKNVESKGENP